MHPYRSRIHPNETTTGLVAEQLQLDARVLNFAFKTDTDAPKPVRKIGQTNIYALSEVANYLERIAFKTTSDVKTYIYKFWADYRRDKRHAVREHRTYKYKEGEKMETEVLQNHVIVYDNKTLDGFASAFIAYMRFKDAATYMTFEEFELKYNTDAMQDKSVIIMCQEESPLGEHHLSALLGKVKFLGVLTDSVPAKDWMEEFAVDKSNLFLTFNPGKHIVETAWMYLFAQKAVLLPELLAHIADVREMRFPRTAAVRAAMQFYAEQSFEFWSFIINSPLTNFTLAGEIILASLPKIKMAIANGDL